MKIKSPLRISTLFTVSQTPLPSHWRRSLAAAGTGRWRQRGTPPESAQGTEHLMTVSDTVPWGTAPPGVVLWDTEDSVRCRRGEPLHYYQ